MKWIGLTGGIATGKSSVSRLLLSLGTPVIDADKISHDLSQIGSAGYHHIVSAFGRQILNTDQTLNRSALGKIIFNDLNSRQKLESVLHPLIQQKVLSEKLMYQNAGHLYCIYDVPLLFEKKMAEQFDATILVYAPLHIQLNRLMKRNNLNNTEALSRLKSQLPACEKIKNSKFCIDNSTTHSDLEIQVKSLHSKLIQSI